MFEPSAAPAFDSLKPWGSYLPNNLHALLLKGCYAMPGSVAPLKRVTVWLRRPMKRGVRRPLDVTIWGLRLRLLPQGNRSEIKLLFAPQYFDRAEFLLLARHLRPGDCFLDIGANAGAYSFWAHRCTQGRIRILAVEPDPEMRRRLAFNIDTNALTSIEVCPVALSDSRGHGELFVKPSQRGENTLVQERASQADQQRVERVELETLVHLLETRGVKRVDALKIDIEGHEPPVLRHFFQHAPESVWPGLVITEYKRETAPMLEEQFRSCGYRRVLSNSMNLAFAR